MVEPTTIWPELEPDQWDSWLADDLRSHLTQIGIGAATPPAGDSKEAIRRMHAAHRAEVNGRVLRSLGGSAGRLLTHFADGREVVPKEIAPRIEFVKPGEKSGDLFRLATLLWSVPVSAGYGRRMRMLVWDDSNDRLIGLAGLTDPVFNLRARDEWVGWGSADREARLVHTMDAFVLGAVPPYNDLLGGKLIAALLAADEVRDEFARKYHASTGVISGTRKSASLSLITVTSSLGRSSIYNRMRLDVNSCRIAMLPVGYTSGFGHFHVSGPLFDRLRDLLALRKHPYATGNRFGNGPNWRMRVIRAAIGELGMDPTILRHGIEREVYVLPVAQNALRFLAGVDESPLFTSLPASAIGAAGLDRWVLPRAQRYPDYVNHRRSDTVRLLSSPRT